MTRRTSLILILALVAILAAAVTVSAGQGTPDAGSIPGSEKQSTARLGNETGTATQAGPCGPACRRQSETGETGETVTVTVTVTKTVYVVYCPIVLTAPVTVSPDLIALPNGAN